MPQRKKNAPLVMEEELMEAVSARVTDNIRLELEECFASFERVLGRVAPHGTQPVEPETTETRKCPAEEDLPPPPRPNVSVSGLVTDQPLFQSHSSFSNSARPMDPPIAKTPASVLLQEPTRSTKSRPEAHRPPLPNVNNNNNTATWNAWREMHQPFSSQHSPGHQGHLTTATMPPWRTGQVYHGSNSSPTHR